MDEKQLRMQCLQQAQQILAYNGTAGSVRPTPESIIAGADQLYTWVTAITPPVEVTP